MTTILLACRQFVENIWKSPDHMLKVRKKQNGTDKKVSHLKLELRKYFMLQFTNNALFV